MARRFDELLRWLMRPRMRRMRRWAFVATVPLGLLIDCGLGALGGLDFAGLVRDAAQPG